MKLKVTFEKKDMITFGIFAVIVFILFAIGVSNLAYFSASGGEFYGFSPMYALENHFGTTLILYLVLIAVLIFSVKDKFFEFEKGFGFSTQKKLEGYNRWAEPKEIKSELKPVRPGDPKANAGGIVLICASSRAEERTARSSENTIGSSSRASSQILSRRAE